MKHKLYKCTFLAIFFFGNIFAQKFDKKYSENFNVNKDVEVAIDASNTEVNVTIWSKNEVQINAFIEIEGLSREEAEKYFKNWNFEALGNQRKVKITAKGSNTHEFDDNFVFFNNMDFNFQDIQLPDFDSIVVPQMNFDFDFDDVLKGMDSLDEIVGKDGNYSFQWFDGDSKININSKDEWEAFKKTKKYKELKKRMTLDKVKMKKEFADSQKQMKEELAKVKLEFKKIDKEKIRAELEKANAELKKLKLNFSSVSNDLTIKGKKVKIKKRLEIKVPKDATFDLNTRHSKVKLPNTAASGSVKYGSFDANRLNGGNLNIDFSKVTIADLNACTLFLNNVTDAKIASVTDSEMFNNSSNVIIEAINKNAAISDRFGELTIQSIIPDYQLFKLMLDNSEAELKLSTSNDKIKLLASNVVLPSKISEDKKTLIFNGVIQANSNDNTFKIEGKNSKLTIIKENL